MNKIKKGDTVLVTLPGSKELAVVKAVSARTGGLTVKTTSGVTYNVMPYECIKQTSVEVLGV
jgi:hypothetical protein